MTIDDSKLFREMSEPHTTKDALNDDLLKFYEGVRALRKECHLQNVVCLVQTPYMVEDKECLGTAVQTVGDRTQAQALCAYAYGSLRSEWADDLAQMLKGKP